ncbi:MAG TPA: hypothetical protein VJ603_03120 [Paucimonas sp.]|nr:hypothetical protein [Paucimonas sp.]HJW56701.1 hypothetical protein [Burkholderiaceae bacterium]
MATIIAGRFQQQTQVQEVISELLRNGFQEQHVSSFYVNPAGQHDLHPIGGDRDQSPGTQESGKGMAAGEAIGGALGAAAGMAAAPLAGPASVIAGVLVGAHAGSLPGTLSHMADADETPLERHSGMLVAAEVGNAADEADAIATLRAFGACDIERADGVIENGDWSDFDPLSTPVLVDQPPEQRP